MKRLALILTAFLIVANAVAQDKTDCINMAIGNVGQLLQPTRPTVHLPNQMVRMYPVRADYMDDQISWFPMSIISHRIGELFGIKPMNRSIEVSSWDERLAYDHQLEKIKPWHYHNFLLEENVGVDFVPAAKAGWFAFDFSKAQHRSLLFQTFNQGQWQWIDPYTLTGVEEFDGMKAFIYCKFNQAAKFGVADKNGIANANGINAKNAKTWAEFKNDQLSVKYGFSFISIANAEKNLKAEISEWDLAGLEQKAQNIWKTNINQIQVEGGTEAEQRVFYTALYRYNERMVDINENGQYYSHYDRKVHESNQPMFVDDWIWDTYLAQHPLRMILNPELETQMLQSYLALYQQGGWLPQFPLVTGDSPCMNGFHSSILFLDAYRKGIRNFDQNLAFQGMMKNATQATMLPWRVGEKCRLDDFYAEKGYYPALHPGEKETVPQVHSWEKRQAVAITLGHSYDDWAVAQMAHELNKEKENQLFSKRSKNYQNVWRQDKAMMWPKDSAGKWIEIDPRLDGGMGGRDYYDENNGWTYLWQVQHDIPGLINLMGGKSKFEKKLDQTFREDLGCSRYEFWSKFPDATGLVGQYSMGNEPSFHIPYLYNFTDAPWKTQKRIRFLLSTWFRDDVFGIPGDEDGGGMSSFVVFSMMGFYPITPGLPIYTIGSPVFRNVSIQLKNGKTFHLIAQNASTDNKYIQRAWLNGKELKVSWFTHEVLENGGTLKLEMGSLPNKSWAVGSIPDGY